MVAAVLWCRDVLLDGTLEHLERIQGKIKKEDYLNIYTKIYQFLLTRVPIQSNKFVQQDGVSKRTAKIVKNWLHKQTFNNGQWRPKCYRKCMGYC